MPNYRRSYHKGGTFFFTLVTNSRKPFFNHSKIRFHLKQAIIKVKLELPFNIPAQVLLPDHWHFILTLPQSDINYSKRIGRIKALTTKMLNLDPDINIPESIWQKRFWEHQIRDELDFQKHLDYIHINPVKHGLTKSVKDWPYSTFHKYYESGLYPNGWGEELELEGEFGE